MHIHMGIVLTASQSSSDASVVEDNRWVLMAAYNNKPHDTDYILVIHT